MMKYEIIKQAQPIQTVGYTIHIRIPEEREKIFALWEKFNRDRAKIPNSLGTAYGISEFGGDKVKYSATMEVSKIDHIPEGMTAVSLPPQNYAQFIHHGPVHEVGKTCEAIYQTLPKTDLKPAGPLVEVYSKDIKGVGNETVPVLLGLQ
jgi:predicted transcriptional regulator YdeE